MKKGKGYAIYTIVTTLGEEAALAVVVLWGLPLLGINIPWWGLILMMVALAAASYITYWFCQRALRKRAQVGLEALIGNEGKTTCRIAPKGYVRVQGELWKATSADKCILEEDTEVVIAGISNYTLLVTPLHESNGSSEAG